GMRFVETGCPVYPIERYQPWSILRAAWHLATAKVVVIDNYYAFLSVAHFRRHVVCIQLWHASGAFKTFGLGDRSINARSAGARRRFKRVYQHFDKIIVGSDQMEQVFRRSFGLGTDHFIHTGIPKTDPFFDQQVVRHKREHLKLLYGNRTILLYAPTFRDDQLMTFTLPFDSQAMEARLGARFVLLLKLHPLVARNKTESLNSSFIKDCSDQPISDLLMGADILITDYSSIPFDFALLRRPMIFYAYDLESYKHKRGLSDDYLKIIPGQVVTDEQTLIRTLLEQRAASEEQVSRFSERWNHYSNGHSSANVAHYIARLLH
ncbi:MAG: CDP-glycerol glycerophosphotransferase family protein, partial [Sporolactobacillus sp.]